MRIRVVLALAAILGVALAACSGGGDDDSSGDDAGGDTTGGVTASSKGNSGKLPDACSLLTPDQIKAQFNVTVGPGKPSSTSGDATAPECSWQPIDFTTAFAGVTLSVQKDDKGAFFEFTRNGAKDRVDVPGLGDAAFFQAPTNPYTLWIRRGDTLYTFYVVASGGAPAENQQKVIALAKLALAK